MLKRILIGFLFVCFAHADLSLAVDDLECRVVSAGAALVRGGNGSPIANYDTLELCEKALGASRSGVVCVWFTPEMPIGPGGWNETGWRAMNIETKIGLGRRPMVALETCLETTRNCNGGVVCTNTGLGFKPTHTQTNEWCGASSQLPYCVQASVHALDHVVCSFPSDGTGAEAGWVKTKITTECDYQGPKLPVKECSASIRGD